MNSYYVLELLANDRMRERMAEADHERMLTEARRANAVATFLRRVRAPRPQPTPLSLEKNAI
jgi:hypothetical protein